MVDATSIEVTRREPAGIGVAARWYRNGDHPLDGVGETVTDPVSGEPYERVEGAVVRFYRHPRLDGDQRCEKCRNPMRDHGWVDSDGDGQVVHPGDWVSIIEQDRGQGCSLSPAQGTI